MGLSFFEVMRGELVDRWGRRHPADFSIKAEASHLGHFARTGKARITGVVHAAPWADHAALEGEVNISLLRRKEIAYYFRFRGKDDAIFELSGRKSIRWLAAVHTLTHMSARLTGPGGEELARGELIFDTNDLPGFLRSWFPSSSIRGVDLHAPVGAFPVLGTLPEAEERLVRALVEAVIAPGEKVPGPDEETVRKTLEQYLRAPADLLPAFRAAIRGLDALALARRGRLFASLELGPRRELLRELIKDDRAIGGALAPRLLVMATTIPVKTAHFDRDDFLEAIGFPKVEPVAAEPKPRWFGNVTPAEDLERDSEVECDVVVVGTGAGGAAIASALAARGVAVALVEEGRYRRREDFVGKAPDRVHRLWRDNAMTVSLGTPVALPLGRVVGGTTTINSGTCYPTPDAVLESWRSDLGFPDDFAPDVYGRWSEQVARMLQVEPGTTAALGKIAQVIARGADALGLEHGPLPRNAPGCPGKGACILGCPEGAKRSTDVSYVPAALKAGATLFTGLPVTRLLMRGGRCVAVEARGADLNGEAKTLRVRAKRVVLACGSLLTPVLLMDNGLELPWLGRNLSVHPALGLVARCEEDLEPWAAIPQGYTVHALEDIGVRFEGYWTPPQLMGAVAPWIAEELSRWMDDFRRLGQFGFMVRDKGNGRVRRGPDGRGIVSYHLDRPTVQALKRGAALCAEIFLRGGASEVYTGIGSVPPVKTVEEARRVADVAVSPLDFGLLGAHPLGTVRMGASPEVACVDFEHRVFGTENLYVVDGGAVPTSLGVNPQMTIMAMALRAGERMADGLA